MSNYWRGRPLDRRTVLRGAGLGVAGLAGAALVGCGSSEEAASTPAAPRAAGTAAQGATATKAADILTPIVDTSDQAVAGGTLNHFRVEDVGSLDPFGAGIAYSTLGISRFAYPLLVQFKPGVVDAPTGELEGQLAESWELPDPTTLIFHLRPNAKWDPRAPTDSRAVTAEDVVFSWNRFATNHVQRGNLANSASATAPVLNVEAIDESTVQVNAAFQFGPLVASFADANWVQIMPVEAEGGFDPRNEIRGAGAWMLDDYQRGVRFSFVKNPNYWRADTPHLDAINLPIIAEYAQRLAQFRAGKIDFGVVNQNDVLDTKKEFPELDLYQDRFSTSEYQLGFGLRPDSPFRDERVRRAVSNLIDRESAIEAATNAQAFRDADWPVDIRWVSLGVAPAYDAFWLDPQGIHNEGYNANELAAWAFDPAEARKLMEAAGYGDGVQASYRMIVPAFGAPYERTGAVWKAMLQDGGLFKLDEVRLDFTTDGPGMFYAQGDYEGIYWGPTASQATVAQHLNVFYHSHGAASKTAFHQDPGAVEGTAESDALIDQAMQALEFDEQVELIHRWQKENVVRMPIVPTTAPLGMAPFSVSWPWLKNYGAYRDYLVHPEATIYTHYWVDENERRGR